MSQTPAFSIDKMLRKAEALTRRGEIAEAERLCVAVLERFPANRRAAETLRAIKLAARNPVEKDAARSLIQLYNTGEFKKMLDAALPLVERHGTDPWLWNVIGSGHAALANFQPALDAFDKVLEYAPESAGAYVSKGNVLSRQRRLREAIACFEAADRYRPHHAGTFNNLGVAHYDLREFEQAIKYYDRAIAIDPRYADPHHNRAVALQDLRRTEEAIAGYRKALELQPDHAAALNHIIHQRANICDWSHPDFPIDLDWLGIRSSAVPPFFLMATEDRPDRHLARARRWASDRYGELSPLPTAPARSLQKIRIGYFSADFRDHAVMHLLSGVLEKHDRTRFEIHAFSFGPDTADAMRSRVKAGVDRFHDVRAFSDLQAAKLARDCGIDIAVDLTGYTHGSRTGIMALRAAPVQINYLGFPGSMGASFIDYILADKYVIPPGSRQYYSEKVIYLPGSYMPFDDTLAVSSAPVSRAEEGLDSFGVVYCSFNNKYKISEREFDVWMRLLARVERSGLWLRSDNEASKRNLRLAARQRGIDPARIVFAGRAPIDRHLARHRCADLFLDSFTFNAHTTAMDALRSGLPVLTCSGQGFAARVATSLLHAVDMPELITDSPDAYEALALDLATDTDRLSELRDRLADNIESRRLFDTARITEDLERAYELALAASASGKPLVDIVVPNG